MVYFLVKVRGSLTDPPLAFVQVLCLDTWWWQSISLKHGKERAEHRVAVDRTYSRWHENQRGRQCKLIKPLDREAPSLTTTARLAISVGVWLLMIIVWSSRWGFPVEMEVEVKKLHLWWQCEQGTGGGAIYMATWPSVNACVMRAAG